MAKKVELTDIGGKCPNCGQEENWLVLHRDKVEGTEYDYNYLLQCQTQIRHDPLDEFGVGEIETCKQPRDITICEEPEYNKEDDPDFFKEQP